uniref:EGF-like domain-containing protein n=1 Tax=Strongyloides venezuelensis TaxID=75913 RepID=A0A0K0EZ94_STRVS
MKALLNILPSLGLFIYNLFIYTNASDENYALTYQYEIVETGTLSVEYFANRENRSAPVSIYISENVTENKQLLVFKISLDIKNLPQVRVYHKMIFHVKYKDDELENIWIPKNEMNRSFKLSDIPNEFHCNLKECKIGLLSINNDETSMHSHGDVLPNDFIYISLEIANNKRRFQLGTITVPTYIHNLYAVICPSNNWVSEYGLVKYNPNNHSMIHFPDGTIDFLDRHIKLMNPWNRGEDNFCLCGHLEQKFGLPLDIGYNYYQYYASEPTLFVDEYSLIFENDTLLCEEWDIFNKNVVAFIISIPEYNFQSNRTTVHQLTRHSKFYSGEIIAIMVLEEIKGWYAENDGFNDKFEIQTYCNVPNFNANLRLRINESLQELKTIDDDIYGEIDSFTIDYKIVKNDIPADCYLEYDKQGFLQFQDLYVKRFRTSLQMYDEDDKKYFDVVVLKLLESNKKYKCSLIVPPNHPDVEELDFISEYEFIVIGNKDLYNNTFQNSTENFANNTYGNNLTNSTGNRSENTTKSIKLVIYISIGIFGFLIIIAGTAIFIWIIKNKERSENCKSKFRILLSNLWKKRSNRSSEKQ